MKDSKQSDTKINDLKRSLSVENLNKVQENSCTNFTPTSSKNNVTTSTPKSNNKQERTKSHSYNSPKLSICSQQIEMKSKEKEEETCCRNEKILQNVSSKENIIEIGSSCTQNVDESSFRSEIISKLKQNEHFQKLKLKYTLKNNQNISDSSRMYKVLQQSNSSQEQNFQLITKFIETKKQLLNQKLNQNLAIPVTENNLNTSQNTAIQMNEDKQSEVLIDRLASGVKAKLTKKDMYNLTNKNYQRLPEIVEKNVQIQRSLELRDRKKKAKELSEKLRQQIKNKIAL